MTDIADRYRAAADHFDRTVGAVTDWSAASPCEGWAAQDVFDHVVTTEEDFLARRVEGYERPSGPAPERWAAVRAAVAAHLDDPSSADAPFDGFFGPTTFARTIDQFYTADLIVHRWDIARAAGLEEHEATTADERALLHGNLDQIDDAILRQPGLFGPAIAMPPGADEHTSFIAWLGRRP